METREATIVNIRGLHARAASALSSLAKRFECATYVIYNNERVPTCSIMDLLMLGAAKGATIKIEGEGEDAAQACDALCELVEQRFGEDC